MVQTFLDNPELRPSATGRAILVGIELTNGQASRASAVSLDELAGLAATANYQPVARYTQRLANIHAQTYIGKGKVEELIEAVRLHQPEVVIFDEVLSPAQNRNLQRKLDCRVIDRHWLILEIFSDHAHTREAKTQVELARLKYAMPRLTRMWGHLSRQRGGIGLKEVGEKQIQLDKRMIRGQIHKLEKKLKQIDRERQVQRKSRRGVFQVALVGYTNVGKSTLMNCLTEAATHVENKLFATLDATVRKIKKNFPYPILLADTVGLIDKLPHELVASFKSTLDEVRDAQLLLHVVDFSHPDYRGQMQTARELLGEIAAGGKDQLLVFNKIDRVEDAEALAAARLAFPQAVFVSCKQGTGLDALRQAIVTAYEAHLKAMRVHLSYAQAGMMAEIRKSALVVHASYEPERIVLDLRVWPERREHLKRVLKTAVILQDAPS